MNKRKSQHYIT